MVGSAMKEHQHRTEEMVGSAMKENQKIVEEKVDDMVVFTSE